MNLFPLLVLYIISILFLDVIHVDSAQYASITMEQWQEGRWLHFFDRGEDYLDKPPLLFWFAQLAYSIFGVSTFAYKLPSVVSFPLALIFLYLLMRTAMGKKQILYTLVIYAFSFGGLYMLLDIKTDNLLVLFILGGLWAFEQYIKEKQLKYLFLMTLFISMGLLAKGPLAIFILSVWIGTHLVVSKDWERFTLLHVILFIVSIIVFLGPYLWGLYTQYDHGFEGVQFFLWDQSFGRITGSNVWNNDKGYFYFLHVIVLFFLPFLGYLIHGLYSIIIHRKFNSLFISKVAAVALLTTLALSFSHYKLPHYIFPVLPMLAILSGYYALVENKVKRVMQGSISIILGLALCIGAYISSSIWAWSIVGLCIPMAYLIKDYSSKNIVIPALTSVTLFVIISNFLLPKLLSFHQLGIQTCALIEDGLNVDHLVFCGVEDYSMEFYGEKRIPKKDWKGTMNFIDQQEVSFVYTNEDGKAFLQEQEHFSMVPRWEFPYRDLNRIKIKDILWKQIPLEKRYILEVKKL